MPATAPKRLRLILDRRAADRAVALLRSAGCADIVLQPLTGAAGYRSGVRARETVVVDYTAGTDARLAHDGASFAGASFAIVHGAIVVPTEV